jgi:hypothetical protein
MLVFRHLIRAEPCEDPGSSGEKAGQTNRSKITGNFGQRLRLSLMVLDLWSITYTSSFPWKDFPHVFTVMQGPMAM